MRKLPLPYPWGMGYCVRNALNRVRWGDPIKRSMGKRYAKPGGVWRRGNPTPRHVIPNQLAYF